VTLSAGNRGVHSAQGIARLVVIELWNRADWFPPTGRVAVLTGGREISVRTVRTRRGLRLRPMRECGKRKSENQNEFRCNPSAHEVPLAFVLYPQREVPEAINIGFAIRSPTRVSSLGD